MKKIITLFCTALVAATSFAQTDTTKAPIADTVKIGGMVIIRKGGPSDTSRNQNVTVNIGRSRNNSRISTNWWIVDLGFANFSDKTNYAAAQASGFVAPGVGEDNLELRTGKSVNVNVWIFMQRLRLIKNAVGLKYGLGLELNNYRFDDERVFLEENPTRVTLAESLRGYSKNKLAADYVTVPIMLNFNFTPNRRRGFGFAAGVSGGYLYSARQKFKNDGDIDKNHDNYDLRKFKLSYIGELSLGPVKLYGSMANKSMWERGLDQTPFNIGIRLSYF